VTPQEQVDGLAALGREVLEQFNSDPRSPYTLIARITRDELAKYTQRLADLEREDTA
jgi:hypothetical protein